MPSKKPLFCKLNKLHQNLHISTYSVLSNILKKNFSPQLIFQSWYPHCAHITYTLTSFYSFVGGVCVISHTQFLTQIEEVNLWILMKLNFTLLGILVIASLILSDFVFFLFFVRSQLLFLRLFLSILVSARVK